jgi:hypothetical protein
MELDSVNVEQSNTDSFSIDTWVGDLDSFRQILTVCRELEAKAKADYRGQRMNSEGHRKEQYFRENSYLGADTREAAWSNREQFDEQRALNSYDLSMTAVEQKLDHKVSGSPDDVMRMIDVSDLKTVSLAIGSVYSNDVEGVLIHFERDRGCTVKISSPRNEWVHVATGKLKPLLSKHRPPYWWLRQVRYSFLLFAVPLFAMLMALLVHGTHHPYKSGELTVVSLAVMTVCCLIGAGIGEGVRNLLPAFELIEKGQKAKGSKRIGLVLAPATWLLGVIVPLVLR